jgi:hypothetical protein
MQALSAVTLTVASGARSGSDTIAEQDHCLFLIVARETPIMPSGC